MKVKKGDLIWDGERMNSKVKFVPNDNGKFNFTFLPKMKLPKGAVTYKIIKSNNG